MAYVALNFGTSTLASGINASATTINVQTGHGVRFAVGSDYSYLVLENTSGNTEVVKITGQTGDALTVVRAQDGTTARSWVSGDVIECRPVAAAIADIFSEATTAGTSAVSAHLSDTTDAHDASAISYAGSAGLASTDVEAALDELDSEKTTPAAVAAQIQGQTATAFTTTGTSTAYLLTPAPAIAANTAGTRFRVSFHTAPTGTPTLAVSGQPALPLKYKDSSGTKQSITPVHVPANWTADVETDGTDWLVLDVPPTTIGGTIGVITAAAILAQILTVDGSGSGLDADTLDGVHASALAGSNSNFSWVEVWNSGYSQASYQINCRANFGEGVYWGRNDAAGNFYSAGVIITNGRGSTHNTTADYTTNDTSVSTADVLGVAAYLGTARIYKLKKDA